MPITSIEGFKYMPTTKVQTRNAGTGTSTWTRRAGRFGNYAISHEHSTTADTTTASGALVIRTPHITQYAIGFAAYHPRAHAASIGWDVCGVRFNNAENRPLCQVSISGGRQVGESSGTFTSVSGLTVLDSSITTVGWHWWSLNVQSNDGSTGFARIYRDGTLMIQQSPDTANPLFTSGMDIVEIFMGNNNGLTGIYVSDLIINSTNTTAIPDMRVDVLAPNGTVTNDWVGSDGDSVNNHLLVDDAGPTPDTADYVQSVTIGASDIYNLEDLPHNPQSVGAVQVSVFGTRDAGGSVTMAPVLNGVEGTTFDTGLSGIGETTWVTNPAGGAAWTKASVDAMTAGIRIKV